MLQADKSKREYTGEAFGIVVVTNSEIIFTCDGARAEDSGFGFGERENVLNLEKER